MKKISHIHVSTCGCEDRKQINGQSFYSTHSNLSNKNKTGIRYCVISDCGSERRLMTQLRIGEDADAHLEKLSPRHNSVMFESLDKGQSWKVYKKKGSKKIDKILKMQKLYLPKFESKMSNPLKRSVYASKEKHLKTNVRYCVISDRWNKKIKMKYLSCEEDPMAYMDRLSVLYASVMLKSEDHGNTWSVYRTKGTGNTDKLIEIQKLFFKKHSQGSRLGKVISSPRPRQRRARAKSVPLPVNLSTIPIKEMSQEEVRDWFRHMGLKTLAQRLFHASCTGKMLNSLTYRKICCLVTPPDTVPKDLEEKLQTLKYDGYVGSNKLFENLGLSSWEVTWKRKIKVRDQPSFDSKQIGLLPVGTIILGKEQNGWVQHEKGWSAIQSKHTKIRFLTQVQKKDENKEEWIHSTVDLKKSASDPWGCTVDFAIHRFRWKIGKVCELQQAHRKGLQEGDEIIAVDGIEIHESNHVALKTKLLRGDTCQITYRRMIKKPKLARSLSSCLWRVTWKRGLKIRDRPSFNSNQIGTLPVGSLIVGKERDGWIHHGKGWTTVKSQKTKIRFLNQENEMVTLKKVPGPERISPKAVIETVKKENASAQLDIEDTGRWKVIVNELKIRDTIDGDHIGGFFKDRIVQGKRHKNWLMHADGWSKFIDEDGNPSLIPYSERAQDQVRTTTTNKSIGDWIVIKTLGKGSYSMVKLARHKNTKEYVALKIFTTKDGDFFDSLQQEEVKAEIEALEKLKHQHIIQMKDFHFDKVYQNKSVIFLVLEYASEGSLFEYLSSTGSFNELLTRSYFHQLMQGVSAIHSANLCHLDLKLENLLLNKDFQLKIADFGFAHTINGSDLREMMGTQNYMAPEIFKGVGYNGIMADIWTCGLILFIMVTCAYPYHHAKQDDWAFNKLYHERYDMFWLYHSKYAEFSSLFKDLINKILIIDPLCRISVAKIMKHPWYQKETVAASALTTILSKRKKYKNKGNRCLQITI